MNDASMNVFRFRPLPALALLASVLAASCQREQPAPPKPVPVILPVQMPPPPPQPTPEQIAAAEAKAAAEAEAARKAEVARAEAERKRKAQQQAAKKRPVYTKGDRKPGTPAPKPEEAAKPKEVRFNMTQGGKKMTAEDFDAWMKSQGIRIVPAKPAEPKPEDKP